MVTAADGVEALAYLGLADAPLRRPRQPLALLVTDIEMPRLDGVALARAVVARLPGTPVLLTSGSDPPPETERLLVGVHYEFLAKPFDAAGLWACLARLVPR